MPSMISFVIQRSAIGNSAEKKRKIRPNATTAGPDCHTILRTGGTLRSADTRSCHPLRKVDSSAMIGTWNPGVLLEVFTKEVASNPVSSRLKFRSGRLQQPV